MRSAMMFINILQVQRIHQRPFLEEQKVILFGMYAVENLIYGLSNLSYESCMYLGREWQL